MANNYFTRKLASDELWDTLFFATGQLPLKEKASSFTTLKCAVFTAQIFNDRRITVNGVKCKSIREAKSVITRSL